MKLEAFGFSGYKPFADTDNDKASLQVVELKPLTVVFGKNNSGKSAVVALPRLLLGGLECDDRRLLPLEVRGLKFGGRFVDIIHGGAFFRRPTFHIRATLASESLDMTAALYSSGALAADEAPRMWSYRMRRPEVHQLLPPVLEGKPRLKFGGLLPENQRWHRWRRAATAQLEEMIHLGPTRAPAQASYPEEQPGKLGFDGREAPQFLRVDADLADAVGSWFEDHMEGWRLFLTRGGASFELRVGKGEMTANLAHAGAGLQQVLPVVVHQLWRQRSTTRSFVDVIEQPELHLHAAAQAPLADLFLKTAGVTGGVVLIETHSAPLLLRIQRRIAEGTFPPDDVALYFVDATQSGSHLHRIYLDANGEADWWPAGVFEEDFNEVAAMRRAQRQRSITAQSL